MPQGAGRRSRWQGGDQGKVVLPRKMRTFISPAVSDTLDTESFLYTILIKSCYSAEVATWRLSRTIENNLLDQYQMSSFLLVQY